MSGLLPIEALASQATRAGATAAPGDSNPAGRAGAPGSFERMLLAGVDKVDEKMSAADAKVRAFVLDDSVPLHQVTYALGEARSSFTLLMQVRARLVESWQELSRMQL